VPKVRWCSVAQSSRRFFFGGGEARGWDGAGGGASGCRVTRTRRSRCACSQPWATRPRSACGSWAKVLAATKGITSIDPNTGNASIDTALYLNTSASAVASHLWLEPKSTLPAAGLMGRVFMKTDGKLYVDDGTNWVVVGTQT
jgi:hypothetical protein